MADLFSVSSILKRGKNALRPVWRRSKVWVKEIIGPRDFAWQVRRRMRSDRNVLFATFADKYRIKEYARNLGITTAPLLLATKDPEQILFDSLPPNYFIKANHSSGLNVICLDGKFYRFGNGQEMVDEDGTLHGEKSSLRISKGECIAICTNWLKEKYSPHEWAYNCFEPYIVVEECLGIANLAELLDYRLYTFDGVVKCVSIGSPVYRKNGWNVFFDVNWKPFPLTAYRESLPDPLPPKPGSFNRMLEIAARLGKGVDFLRVDLFDTNRGVVLGEVTLYPEAGRRGTPTHCPLFNMWLAKQWKQS